VIYVPRETFIFTAKTYQESEAAGPASEAKKFPNFR